MKIVALVSFFDERPDWLSACVASLKGVADHVVAVDGAYRLFPQAKAHSGDVQAGAIVATAQALGIGVTYMAPDRPWMKNEVEKRNHALRLALAECEPDCDWVFVIDADSLVTYCPSDFRDQLGSTDCYGGSYFITEDFEGGTGKYGARYLYCAHPSLRIGHSHFDYRRLDENGNEICLWENGGLPCCETSLVVEHRRDQRNEQRNRRALRYYLLRDSHKIEGAHLSR